MDCNKTQYFIYDKDKYLSPHKTTGCNDSTVATTHKGPFY